jgi:hypothetical protein
MSGLGFCWLGLNAALLHSCTIYLFDSKQERVFKFEIIIYLNACTFKRPLTFPYSLFHSAESGRPYTLALIERALRDVHFNVDLKHSAKQQALEVRLLVMDL